MATTPADQSAVPRGSDTNVFGGEDEAGYGWLFFAGTILGLAGLMRILDGFWALRYGGALQGLPDKLTDGVLGDNIKTYGWVWLVVGVLLIISSVLILSRNQFARIFGLIAVFIMTISAMTWMPYYPVWSLTYVVIGMLAVYGLAVHGGREPV